MKLPNGGRAIAEIEKLRDYCLSRRHPRGRHKARMFASALGVTDADAEELREALLRAAADCEATPAGADAYGQRYVLDFELTRAAGKATIRTSWIIRRGEAVPRLTSCYVL